MVSHSNLQDGANTVDTNGSGTLYWEDGNINIDPLFTDSDNGDFTLPSDSPCIDTGTAFLIWQGETIIGMDETEFEGFAPDMGALEHRETTSTSHESHLPTHFLLHQNFPNPFNPMTVISYQLPVSSNIQLTIYDMMGRRVNELVSGRVSSGKHSVIWNGTDSQNNPVASGMYLYQLKSDNFVETKKFILLK